MENSTQLARARLYRGLALGFDKPGEGLVAAIEDGVFASELLNAATAIADQDEEDGFAAETRAVRDTTPADGDALRGTYAATFGTGGEASISRYELSYAPGSLVTNTDRMADIAGFYRAFGLERAEDARDRNDYLPTQLEFLQHLALQIEYLEAEDNAEGVAIATDATRSFLEDHIGRWVPRFVDALEEEVETEFYLALGQLLAAFVAGEVERFNLDPDEFEQTPTAPLEGLTGMERDDAGRLQIDCGAATGGRPSQ